MELQPHAKPAVCLGGNPHVTNLSDIVTPGAITPIGAAHLYINGVALS